MAAVFVLLAGVGGWLMYEAYKGETISKLEAKLLGITQTASGQTTTTAETNTLDTGQATLV